MCSLESLLVYQGSNPWLVFYKCPTFTTSVCGAKVGGGGGGGGGGGVSSPGFIQCRLRQRSLPWVLKFCSVPAWDRNFWRMAAGDEDITWRILVCTFLPAGAGVPAKLLPEV